MLAFRELCRPLRSAGVHLVETRLESRVRLAAIIAVMIKSLAQELLDQRILNRNDLVVVAVSGGADSMALLHLLRELNSTVNWELRLHVAHLNHQLRIDDADDDAAFVQAACDDLSLSCTIEVRDIAARAAEEGIGIEELARRERYLFFERVCLNVGAKTVAVAHHADDNAETILHRILRGTGLRGLAGISRRRAISPASDISVTRPLLNFTRQQIREYLASAGIAFREDKTNESNEPMRNRIRNVILPALTKDVNPQVRDALTRLGSQARWLEEFLGETVQRTFDTLVVSRNDQTLTLNAGAMAKKSRIVQTELVRLAYASFGLGEQDLAFNHLVSALDLIADPASGRQTQLPGGMTIEKRYHQLIFSLPSDQPREALAPQVAIHLPGKTSLPIRAMEIDCEIQELASGEIQKLRRTPGRLHEVVDLDVIRAPLVVRSRRVGDRFFPLGAPGSKSVADFLADEKVDPALRPHITMLCDQLGPIWLVGYRIDDRAKLTSLTKRALHLKARSISQ